MRIQQQFPSILAILLSLVAGLSCDRNPETGSTTRPGAVSKSTHVGQRVEVTEETDRVEYEAKPHDASQKGSVVGKIEFEVRDPEWVDDGPSPYVSIENPGKDIKFMDNPNEIVVSSKELQVVIDYPVTGIWEFKITSTNSEGFTRAGLAEEISRVYQFLYSEEERTTKIKVVPSEQRKKLLNRNRTNGKYGIWGHDIGDLDLHTVELHKTADGKLYAVLGIDS